jgi:MOSC domain-containing protein YiiM
MSKVVSIHIAEKADGKTEELSEAELVAGKGIVGDRYFLGIGNLSGKAPSPDRELTLIAKEEVQAFNQEYGLSIPPGDMRRNIVTQGINLNDMVDIEFSIGEVKVKGIRLCEPCQPLAYLLAAEIIPGMVHRAGLRAQIVVGGVIRPGDRISTTG